MILASSETSSERRNFQKKYEKGEKLMKNRVFAVLLSAAMVMSMAACGSSSSSDSSSASSSDDVQAVSTEAEATASANSGAGLKVGLVTDTGGVEDQSFNQSAWEGLQRAADELGVEVQYLSSSTDADYAPNLETFVDEDYDLIISVGYLLADATREAAEANPDVQFAIIDDSSIDLDNVTSLTFKAEQATYLVGYVAGLMTETDTIGFVLGMASETMHPFGYGYCAGAIDANPDIKILQGNANSFSDPAMGSTLTTNFVTNGADIVFAAAGATGTGAISECQAQGIYAIGVDSDQSPLAPETVITSAMKRVDNAVYDTVESLVDGSLSGGVKTYDISAGGVDIAPTTDLLPEDVLSAIEEVKAKMISGEIEVPATQADFDAKYGNVYELDD
jgi:basic membrane protein A